MNNRIRTILSVFCCIALLFALPAGSLSDENIDAGIPAEKAAGVQSPEDQAAEVQDTEEPAVPEQSGTESPAAEQPAQEQKTEEQSEEDAPAADETPEAPQYPQLATGKTLHQAVGAEETWTVEFRPSAFGEVLFTISPSENCNLTASFAGADAAVEKGENGDYTFTRNVNSGVVYPITIRPDKAVTLTLKAEKAPALEQVSEEPEQIEINPEKETEAQSGEEMTEPEENEPEEVTETSKTTETAEATETTENKKDIFEDPETKNETENPAETGYELPVEQLPDTGVSDESQFAESEQQTPDEQAIEDVAAEQQMELDGTELSGLDAAEQAETDSQKQTETDSPKPVDPESPEQEGTDGQEQAKLESPEQHNENANTEQESAAPAPQKDELSADPAEESKKDIEPAAETEEVPAPDTVEMAGDKTGEEMPIDTTDDQPAEPEEKQPEKQPDESAPEIVEDTKEFILPEDRSVDFEILWDTEEPAIGDSAHFAAILSGYDELEYTLQWQYSTDDETWFDIPGETGMTMDVIATEENADYYWRVIVNILGPKTTV